MKKYTLFGFLFASLLFSSCLKDKCLHTYSLYRPLYHTKPEVRANIKSNSPKALERPGKLFVKDQFIFLNEIDRGIHIIDNSNPSSPRKVAFIDIPGNIDLAVNGNTLYADSYNDMVTIDISNPLHVTVKKFTDDAFPFRRYTNGFSADSNKVIVDWVRTDTTLLVSCDRGGSFFPNCSSCYYTVEAAGTFQKNATPFGAGVGGSMARFGLVNDYLYTVSNDRLNVFNVSSPTDPVLSKNVSMGWAVETLYPFKEKLFIGSSSGMFVYDISNPVNPTKVGLFNHVRSCDPVIADVKYAYVTLRSGTTCQGFSNQLDILNIEDLSNPLLLKTYSMVNPHGLSKDKNLLFICDGDDGLKIYDAANVNDIRLVRQMRNFTAYDVIAANGLAILVARDGLYQFDYSNPENVKLISKIGFGF